MTRLFYIGLAVVFLTSCGGEEHAGGPGSETTNGVFAQVYKEDGTVAANLGVALRRVDYQPDSLSLTQAMIIPDVYTDSTGRFQMDNIPQGNYRITALSPDEAFSREITVTDSADVDLGTVSLSLPGSVSGAITLPEGTSYSWVGAYGLDVLVKTDSAGNFIIPELPAREIQLFCMSSGYTETLAAPQLSITSGETTSWTSTEISMLVESFENTSARWNEYFVGDSLTTIVSPTNGVAYGIEYDTLRNSNVFHGQYSTPDTTSWVILGFLLSDSTLDFTALDSIVLYARGDGNMRMSLENWSATAAEEDNLKAWTPNYSLSGTWQRFSITPSDFLSAEEDSTTTGWESVQDSVLEFHIFGNSGTELYIDDIWFYGVTL